MGGTLRFTYTSEETTALTGVPRGNLALLFAGTLTDDTTGTFMAGPMALADPPLFIGRLYGDDARDEGARIIEYGRA
jgi:hypothetical protein